MATSLIAVARVNHGRWLADCPVCHIGAELVTPGKPYVCRSCGATSGLAWPAPKTKAQIEQLLALRPDPVTRNWTPGETVKLLAAENAAHGLPVKEG